MVSFNFLKVLNGGQNPFSTGTQKETARKDEALFIFAKNLEVPWGIQFLPGSILFTERPGKLWMIDVNGGKPILIAQISQVKAIGEGGLLGIASDPNFKENKNIYLYYTYEKKNENTFNRVVKYKLGARVSEWELIEEKILVDKIPGAPNHNGGRIKFGPDGMLYITTGDAQNPSFSQDTNSLAGKILRVDRQGNIPKDNPFKNHVWTYGHRNPQGLAWDNQGNLWATEHGQSNHDEVNKIEKGKNYGWPIIQGMEKENGMETPRIESGNETWAPGGAAFLGDSLFFGGLRGTALFEFNTSEQKIKKYLENKIGRIRDVVAGPDGMLYITTSNRDGRSKVLNDDDKILRVNPARLSEL
ncbi:MAG: Quinoprotein glucose dehydrogenase [Candidatus Levybacteria bacterium GW2011_GWB1_39_7]|nr:MAG: Quinoprotein glucose dehydrogenase [Candidatus Levybacteria bacterium GW2011_GWA1_39_11]KKR24749.1 MAG: Quinoprotein glucose dehydrogenase [Candidatus Levybacteria bacterium GW2011_GWB1_39_7]